MDLPSLRRLVKETISETKRRNREVFGNPKSTKRQRQQFINETIDKTVRILMEEMENNEELQTGDGASDQGNAGDNTGAGGSVPVVQNQGQNKPYSKLIEALFGQATEAMQIKTGTPGGFELATHKTKIREEIAKIIQQHGKEALDNGALKGASSEDAVSFSDKDIICSKLKPSQSEVFINQSVDGYLTRDNGAFGEAIKNGTLEARTVWVSNEGYIIDGHHRTASAVALNPFCTLQCTQMDGTIEYCLKLLNLILEVNAYGQDKKASGDPNRSIWKTLPTPADVLKVWKQAVGRTGEKGNNAEQFTPKAEWRTQSAVEANRAFGYTDDQGRAKEIDKDGKAKADEQSAMEAWFLDLWGGEITQGTQTIDLNAKPDKSLGFQQWEDSQTEGGETKQGIKSMYGNNLNALAYMCALNLNVWNKPESRFGGRPEMPQLDSKQGRNVKDDGATVKRQLSGAAEDGVLDWNPPIAESDEVNESIDLKRWAKLAGILKG